MATERMGLRVTKNTLKEDWEGSTGELAGILGHVQIEVTESCILREDLILQIAPLLAADVAWDRIEQTIEIDAWSIKREGNLITLEATEYRDTNPRVGASTMDKLLSRWSGFDVSLVVLIIPNVLLWV